MKSRNKSRIKYYFFYFLVFFLLATLYRPFIYFNVNTLTKTEIYSPLVRNEYNNKTGIDNNAK